MSYHPLTEKVWALIQRASPPVDIDEIDAVVEEYLPEEPKFHSNQISPKIKAPECCGVVMHWKASKLVRCHWTGERWTGSFSCLSCGVREWKDPWNAPRGPVLHTPLTCCGLNMEMNLIVPARDAAGRDYRFVRYECQVCGTDKNIQDFG